MHNVADNPDDEKRTEWVGVRLKPSTRAALERLAKADKRKLSPYIEIALEDHILQKDGGKSAGKRK
jgi:hypothetical protein